MLGRCWVSQRRPFGGGGHGDACRSCVGKTTADEQDIWWHAGKRASRAAWPGSPAHGTTLQCCEELNLQMQLDLVPVLGSVLVCVTLSSDLTSLSHFSRKMREN